MSEHERTCWFAAKSYGLGWTLPITWQGWLAVLAYLILLISTLIVASTDYRWPLVAILTLALVAIVVWKGEKPLRWRWRGK